MHHAEGLRKIIDNEELVRAIAAGKAVASLSGKERALLDFAVKLTEEPSSCTDADIVALRELGWSDSAILDLNLVVAYFNFVNRIALGLGVELEPSRTALR